MKYISLLRGINVSGQKKILMKDLKSLYGGLGFENVTTYIQSGNVIFTSDEENVDVIRCIIENEILSRYNFSVDVQVWRTPDFESIFKNLPFSDYDLSRDGTKIIITFLSDQPTTDTLEALSAYLTKSEQMIPGKKSLYFRFPDGYGKTKLTNVVIERILKVSSTSRNLKTVAKLFALALE